ncbi:hypothetical protein NSS98_25275 [Paenibacillus sp. FSL E2-0274]|uniref:hypothetical protein n=1 Tax=Paenibacillus TaxID=44249 RepID=UPI00096F4FDD|nr:hypothetical protein [Paenibacillus odorifer]OME29394.1 hypothetical protein BSK63_21840 [Paenibacillus odorifer]
MSATYKVLENDAEFLTAALAQSKVSVWFRLEPDPIGHLMDYGGIVEGYTPDSIKISGGYFVRQRFEFRAEIRSPRQP